MSFVPITWSYTPPKTVPPAPVPTTSTSSSTTKTAASSSAARLVTRIQNLRETAKYLEEAIVGRAKNKGILVDPADTDLNLALERIYGEVPPGVSIAMYDSLLDAQMGVLRSEIAIEETGSTLQPDPTQKADLALITDRVAGGLIEDNTFDSAVPLLLAPLKADRVIYDHLEAGLKEYPILKGDQSGASTGTADVTSTVTDPIIGGGDLSWSPITPVDLSITQTKNDSQNLAAVQTVVRQIGSQMVTETVSDPAIATIDVSSDTTANLDARMDLWETYYYGANDLATQVDNLTNDISSWADSYLYQPLRDLAYACTLLRMLKIFFQKPTLKSLKSTLAGFVFPRLISEMAKFNFSLDRSVQIATGPAENLVRSLNKAFGEIQKNADMIAWLVRPQTFDVKDGNDTTTVKANGLTGIVRSNITGKVSMPPPAKLPKLDTIGSGLAKIGGSISWATREVFRQRDYVETSLFRVMDSKMNEDGSRLEVLDSLRSIDSLIDLTSKYISMTGSPTASTSPIASKLSQLTQLTATNGAASLPTLTPPSAAQTVFASAQARLNGGS